MASSNILRLLLPVEPAHVGADLLRDVLPNLQNMFIECIQLFLNQCISVFGHLCLDVPLTLRISVIFPHCQDMILAVYFRSIIVLFNINEIAQNLLSQ